MPTSPPDPSSGGGRAWKCCQGLGAPAATMRCSTLTLKIEWILQICYLTHKSRTLTVTSVYLGIPPHYFEFYIIILLPGDVRVGGVACGLQPDIISF